MDPVAAEALKQGRVAWLALRGQKLGTQIELRGGTIELDGSQGPWDLSGCDLSESRISGIGWLTIDVSGSDLSGATVVRGSMLQGLRVDKNTVLDRACFDEVTLAGSDLSKIQLNGTSFLRSIVHSVKFGARLSTVRFGRASLREADFRDSRLEGCSLASVQATDCHFDNAIVAAHKATRTPSTLEMAAFRQCSFLDADLGGVSLLDTLFIDSDLRRTRGVRLDNTILRGSVQSAGADDDWSILRRKYTGANMVFNVFAMVIFFLPWIFQALYWSGVNQAELMVLRGLSTAEVQLAEIPGEEQYRLLLARLQRSVDVDMVRCVQPSAQDDGQVPAASACRPIWQILIGVHQGWFAVLLSIALIVYNIARLGLTVLVAPLRDEELRTWHAPSRDAYRRLMLPHKLVKWLMWVAIVAAILHLGPTLMTPVWLMSSNA